MANKVTYGLDKVHIAFSDPLATAPPEWETPIHIPGAVRFTPTTVGEASTFYADNGPYFTVASNNGYTAELEMALVPDAILAEMLGWKIDENGMLVELSDGIQKEFALLGEVLGDQLNRRFVYYQCKASRPAKEQTTQGETIEPTTDMLSLTISPVEINGQKVVRGTMERSDTNATVYDSFFTSVAKPAFSGSEG